MSSNFPYNSTLHEKSAKNHLYLYTDLQEYARDLLRHELSTQKTIFNREIRVKNYSKANNLEDSYENWLKTTDKPVRIPNKYYKDDSVSNEKSRPTKRQPVEDRNDIVYSKPPPKKLKIDKPSQDFTKKLDYNISVQGKEPSPPQHHLSYDQFISYMEIKDFSHLQQYSNMSKRIVDIKSDSFHISRLLHIMYINMLKKNYETALKAFSILIRIKTIDIRGIWPIGLEILKNLNELEFNQLLRDNFQKDLTDYPELLKNVSNLVKNDILVEKYYENFKLQHVDLNESSSTQFFPTFAEIRSIINNRNRVYSKSIVRFLTWLKNSYFERKVVYNHAFPFQLMNEVVEKIIYESFEKRINNDNQEEEDDDNSNEVSELENGDNEQNDSESNDELNVKLLRYLPYKSIMWTEGSANHIPMYFYSLLWELLTNGSYRECIDTIEQVKYNLPYSNSSDMLQYITNVAKYVEISVDFLKIMKLRELDSSINKGEFGSDYLEVSNLVQNIKELKKSFNKIKENPKDDIDTLGDSDPIEIPIRLIISELDGIIEKLTGKNEKDDDDDDEGNDDDDDDYNDFNNNNVNNNDISREVSFDQDDNNNNTTIEPRLNEMDTLLDEEDEDYELNKLDRQVDELSDDQFVPEETISKNRLMSSLEHDVYDSLVSQNTEKKQNKKHKKHKHKHKHKHRHEN